MVKLLGALAAYLLVEEMRRRGPLVEEGAPAGSAG
jgi:hypothetical protein